MKLKKFVVSEFVVTTHQVIIEAESAEDAMKIAETADLDWDVVDERLADIEVEEVEQ